MHSIHDRCVYIVTIISTIYSYYFSFFLLRLCTTFMKNIDCTVKLHINYLYEREKIALENFNMFFFVLLSYAWHGCVCVCVFAKFNAKLYICLHACDHIKFTGLCTQFSMWIPKNGFMYLWLLCVNMFEIIDHICLGQRITLWHTNNRYIPTYTNIMAYNQFITSIEREKKRR